MTTQEISGPLDDAKLQKYMEGFFGYGNPGAEIWLIGMEEGAGRDVEEIRSRINTWAVNNRSFEDVREYHIAFGQPDAFTTKKRAELTWGRLIQLLLRAKGVEPTKERILNIQRNHWARSNGEVCLAELLPLPKSDRGSWSYHLWSTLPELSTRATYDRLWSNRRRVHLVRLIQEHEPKLVIFYGTSFRSHWEFIAGGPMEESSVPRVFARTAHGTEYFMLLHPSPRSGSSKAYFDQVGTMLRDRFGSQLFERFAGNVQ